MSKRRLLVTGANGFVAGSVLAQAGPGWQVHALSRGAAPARRGEICWHACEYTVPAELSLIFNETQPDAVIHTAALADIDLCQSHHDHARTVNVELTRTLVELCGNAGTKLVFCSTDTVFDGENAPYDESAKPLPVNHYAETKVAAEQLVSRLGKNSAIARLSLVVGLPVMGPGNSFLARMRTSLKEGRAVSVPESEIRTPVDVITVGQALLELATGPHEGIFHLAGLERLSRFAMARKIAARFGFSEELVLAQANAVTPGRARRPRDVSLANARTCARLQTPLRSLDDGLALILETSGTFPT